MEELEVKSMLADERIPAQYKLGGRLSSEFLDGVDYAERRIVESGVEVWLAIDRGFFTGSFNFIKAFFRKPVLNKKMGIWHNDNEEVGSMADFYLRMREFPEVTFSNSPVKARIILED
jgi:hypothetical protein